MVQDAYTRVFGELLLLGARAGDLLGRRRVFIFGVELFALASLLVGVAPAGWWLIGARAVQGIGAAVVAPSSLSLLTASFPPGPGRAKAVALYGATAGIGASLGLVIGGALTDHPHRTEVGGSVSTRNDSHCQSAAGAGYLECERR